MTVRFGLIGSGGMARVHADAIAHGGRDVQLVAVSGGRRAGVLATEYGAAAESSVSAVLDRQDVDAVIIATPHTTHVPLALAAASAGKHVFLEKPMALDIAECDEIIGACRAAGVRLMIAHITRFLEATRVARDLVGSGAIGDLRMISVHRLLNGYPNSGWTLEPAEGTAFLDWGSHGADIVRWFAAREPRLAFGQFASYRGGMPAGLSGMVQYVFPDDVMSQIWMSYELPAASWIQRAHYTFTGSDGLVDLNAYGRVEVVRGTDTHEAYTQPDLVRSSVEGVSFNAYFRDGFARQILEFASAVESGREPSVSGHDGRAAIEMVQAAERSAATGQAVSLPLA